MSSIKHITDQHWKAHEIGVDKWAVSDRHGFPVAKIEGHGEVSKTIASILSKVPRMLLTMSDLVKEFHNPDNNPNQRSVMSEAIDLLKELNNE